MRRVRALLWRLLDPIRRRARERDLAAELEAHVELHADDIRRRGLPPDEARRQAVLALGGVEATKERYRDRRGLPFFDALGQDVRQAVRVARGHLGFTAVAMSTLALGIGSVAIIYSVIRHIVIDPFPYAHSDRMVNLVLYDAATNRLAARGLMPGPEFLDYEEQNPVFEDVLGTGLEPMHYTAENGPERLVVAWVTPNMIDFLGVQPLAGRAFGRVDGEPSAPCVAQMNHRTWTSRFAADSSIIGRTLLLNRQPCTVIGVMPPRFEWNIADLWIPSVMTRSPTAEARGARWFQARLRPGVTVEQATQQMDTIVRRRAAQLPNEYPKQFRVEVVKVIDWVVGRFRSVLYTMFAAVGLLLVIACCNVANMLLARASVREREMLVRNALGASRVRIARQLIVENLLLALGGGIGGCLLAYGGIAALQALIPRQNVPWETELRLDGYVLACALITALGSTLFFGLFPALQAARRELTDGGLGGRGTASRRQNRMRSTLISAEVALSVVLLLGAGVLVRSFVALTHVSLGVDPRTILTAGISFAPGTYESIDGRQRFYRAAIDSASRLPGVEAVAITSAMASFGGQPSVVAVAGRRIEETPATLVKFATEGYGRTLGLQLLAGRDLSAAEVDAGRQVAVVNEAFVERYFKGQDPIGQVVGLSGLKSMATPVADPAFEIIGVVEDRLNMGIREAPAPDAYVPAVFRGLQSVRFLVRGSHDALASVEPLRRAVRAVDGDVAIVTPMRLDRILSEEVYAQPRFVLLVFGMFAAAGLVLVALGIYGVLSYTVAQQTREIAIRVAMGGERRDVLSLVMKAGLRLIVVGLAIGLLVSLGTNRLLTAMLWRTSPYDTLTVLVVIGTTVFVGIASCLIPARRAMRIEPSMALRQE